MYTNWIEAERFYTFIMPIIVMIFLILTSLYVMAFTHLKKGTVIRKVLHGGYFLFVAGSVGYFVNGHMTYDYWVEQNEYINPGIRDVTYFLGWRNEEEPETVSMHREATADWMFEDLKELDMYESEIISEPFNFTYLGSESDTYYFSFGEEDDYVFRIRGEVKWNDRTNEIKGWNFSLKDEQFETIGFQNKFNYTFQSLSITEEQKELERDNTETVIQIMDVYQDWIFSDQRY